MISIVRRAGLGLVLFSTAAQADNPPVPIAAAASILPNGRSVVYGTPATVFASFVNTSATDLDGCRIILPPGAPAGLAMSYQTTDPATNAPTGTANAPVPIPGYTLQSFVLSFSADSSLSVPGLAPQFSCSGTLAVPTIPGVNTVDLTFANVPVADIIAIAATASQDGIVRVAQTKGGGGAFAVATLNAGASDMITASADTGGATLPAAIALCQSDPMTAACLAPPAGTVPVDFTTGATPTFSVFVAASAPIGLDPANARIFVRFKDAAGTSHGSTSVAIETQ
jgi:hypothetical protein